MATQAVQSPTTVCATFLVLAVKHSSSDDYTSVRSALGAVGDICKNVSIRDQVANVSATVGIGSSVWDKLSDLPRPKELHDFVMVKGARHTAPSTPGDLFFHIRSERSDMCFELERQLVDRLGKSVQVVDKTVGFRYFDSRDLLGFVDGTANPVGQELVENVMITNEQDNGAPGGSYVVVQKYLHDMGAWNTLSTEAQEHIIGRTKLDNVELPDMPDDSQKPHKQLSTITDNDGTEYSILRDNMPFGSPSESQFGTYFIGYSRHLWVIEKMLQRMFVGDPPGKHDRILDYSQAITGSVFFVPSTAMLQEFGDS